MKTVISIDNLPTFGGGGCKNEKRKSSNCGCGCQNNNKMMQTVTGGAVATELTGKIIDRSTKAPLPATNIYNINDGTGTATGDNGMYSLQVYPNDMIRISFVGYETIELPASQIMEVTELKKSTEELPGVEISIPKKVVDSVKNNKGWWLGAGLFGLFIVAKNKSKKKSKPTPKPKA